MKYLDKIGFVLCLLGVSGMPESYLNPKSIAICLGMLCVGGILIGIGDVSNDVKNYKRDYSSNVLDRLHFLER